MRKVFSIFVFTFLFFFFSLFFSYNKAYATCLLNANPANIPGGFTGDIIFTNKCFTDQSTSYQILVYPTCLDDKTCEDKNKQPYEQYKNYQDGNWNKSSNTDASAIESVFDFTNVKYKNGGSWRVKFCHDLGRGVINETCSVSQGGTGNSGEVAQATLTIFAAPTATTIPPTPTPTPRQDLPKLLKIPNQCVYQIPIKELLITVTNVVPKTHYYWWWLGERGSDFAIAIPSNNDQTITTFTIPGNRISAGTKVLCVNHTLDVKGIDLPGCNIGDPNTLTFQFSVSTPTGDLTCDRSAGGAPIVPTISAPVPSATPVPPALLPCAEGLSNPDDPKSITTDKALIKKCTKIDSAVGPIDTDPAEFIKKIFTVLLSMAGGWAVYLIITAGYQLMFSHGEAEQVQEARDKITSAIVGLVFMLLSLVILRVIGVDIFQLPTFGQ
ncbi:MAG: hypothetical protein HYV39_02075 [Candidatus Levybacteria bacterium]|nr:hypothetical protein [Candidatus Levybacteria bacterium]